ncbi:alpha-1,4-glucan--maltose-1-phosphate maltosyltransferase [Rhizobium sp. RAF36]|uniref:alpha-1,4-glucan--maltose-1-phosphate maltosyltransferase n=1 Tax=Rhizobium sp. RAF36 TaxID=3233055 RepID=UPI003F946105
MMPARQLPISRPRIYYVNLIDLSDANSWLQTLDHAASLHFDTVMTAPLFCGGIVNGSNRNFIDNGSRLPNSLNDPLSFLCESAASRGLGLMMDAPIATFRTEGGVGLGALDPRHSPSAPWRHADSATLDAQALIARVSELSELGVAGFRFLGLERLGDLDLQRLGGFDFGHKRPLRLVYTPGTDFAFRARLEGRGFDGVFSSLAWWDMREGWFLQEHRLQRALGLQVAFPEAPFARRLAHGTEGREVRERRSLRALRLSAALGDGLMIPMGFEFGAVLPLDVTRGGELDFDMLRSGGAFDISSAVREANDAIASSRPMVPTAYVTSPEATAITLADHDDLRVAERVGIVVINRDLRRPSPLPWEIVSQAAAPFFVQAPGSEPRFLAAGELQLLNAAVGDEIVSESVSSPGAASNESERIAIENIEPQVDKGRFAAKRVVGETVSVKADIFADGHDRLAASLLYRAVDDANWTESPLILDNNDRWVGQFRLDRIGRYEFCVEAWKNPFAIYRHELSKKAEAGLDLTLELIEGEALLRKASERMAAPGEKITEILKILANSDPSEKTKVLLSSHLSALMSEADERPFRTRSPPSLVDAERVQAAFASWYQVFPRSQSGDTERHGTFDDVISRLPAIRDMGFDVLYFPPIHPIGSTNRKGRNNSLRAEPGDPGSPYAIGSPEGGHDAIHPELGGFEGFRRLAKATREHGLELALDLAIQASPDHPWLTDHPGWFEWRPDGTIRYAENPPKKYEDIVNVDFYSKDAVPALWEELRDIVQLWVDEGVKLFRVDNPHTKPFPFWEWLIGDIRARHPDVVFLSEAFTRPKVMYRLAKVGFSQSYTYFTWRNTKWELEQYMMEITQTEAKEFFRPHFFVNTHDINPDFLQDAPRPAFAIRAALAATLSGLWGVYNGFELCEGRPDVKRKEYADSEKYEIRAWDYDRPGNIKPEITMLNRIRRDNSALHSHLGLTLLSSSNPNVMFFEKAAPGRHNVLLVGICLNPHGIEESTVEIPLWQFGKDDGGTLDLEDLVSGRRFLLTGKWQTLRLDPWHLPFAIWRVRTGEI